MRVAGGGCKDIGSYNATRVREHDQAEVDADEPEGANDCQRGQGSGLEHCAGEGDAFLDVGGGHLAGQGALVGSRDDFDLGDIVFGVCEAGGVVNGAGTGHCILDFAFVQVLSQDDEPAGAEEAGVGSVDDRVQNEEKREADDLERLFRLPDSGEEPCDQAEDYERVYVVAELERVEVIAGEDGEDAVQAGDFVEEEGEEDEFGGGAEGDEA